MRSQNFKFEKIPLLSFLYLPKHCKQKKALKTEPNSVWDCLGDITYFDKEIIQINKTLHLRFVLLFVRLFVNNKEAHNEKVFS